VGELRNHATRRSGSRVFRTSIEARSEVEKKQPFVFIPRTKWDSNNGIGLKQIGWEVMDINDLPQYKTILWAVVNTKQTFFFHGKHRAIRFSRRTFLSLVGVLVSFLDKLC
jgi:hypothetical protein